MKKKNIGVMIGISLLIGGCAYRHDAPPGKEVFVLTDANEQETEVLQEPEEVFGEAEQDTQCGYGKILSVLGGDANFAYSPESLNATLFMYDLMLDGGEEKNEVEKLLSGRDYLSYENTSSYQLYNRIWIDRNKTYDFSGYLDGYEDLLYAVDMAAPEATDEKNAYVSEKTDGFITQTPSEFGVDTNMDLMNIAYFRSGWNKSVFPMEILPKQYLFTDVNGRRANIEMIGFQKESNYLVTDTAYGYVLEYEQPELLNCDPTDDEIEVEEAQDLCCSTSGCGSETDGKCSCYNGQSYKMYVILPKVGCQLSDVRIEDFLPHTMTCNTRYYYDVHFAMPKFDISCSWNLDAKQPVKEELGLYHFGESSVSLNITDTYYDPQMSQVVRIQVDETGTTAAAVTELDMTNGEETKKYDPFDFICDRPFYYVIYDTVNDDVAFVGQFCEVSR